MTIDPIVQQAHDAARAILQEGGYVNGCILLCEVEDEGLIVAFDDDRLGLGFSLADTLRRAADRVDPEKWR